MVSRDFLDDLIRRTDIVEIIGSHIKLKKKGNNYLALCPFHNEKTPSFTVNPSKQFFYCFGCGASGDTIKFLMQFSGQPFPQILEELSNKYGMKIPNKTSFDPSLAEKRDEKSNELRSLILKAARFLKKI